MMDHEPTLFVTMPFGSLQEAFLVGAQFNMRHKQKHGYPDCMYQGPSASRCLLLHRLRRQKNRLVVCSDD